MRKIIVILLICSVFLCGCVNVVVDNNPTTEKQEQDTTPLDQTEPDTTMDWELPIDVDEYATEPDIEDTSVPEEIDIPNSTSNNNGNTDPTEPPTEAGTSEPSVADTTEVTEPDVSEEPETTAEPETTVPETTSAPSNGGPIELPMIPG